MPREVIEEYVEIIEQTQKENLELNSKVKFFQRELQSAKSEIQSMRLDTDNQYRNSMVEMDQQI